MHHRYGPRGSAGDSPAAAGKPAHAAYLQPPLAGDRVRYVGEPVAVVVATDRAAAADARELVEVEYDPLPARVDPGDGGPLLFAEGDVADAWVTALGDVDAALRGAACVVSERFSIGRQTAAPMETRGLLAEWDRSARRLTVWGMTKVPYFNRRTLAAMLELDEARIDFAECDVGGASGARGEFYLEDFLIPYLARRLARPVKWIEDRREHFLAINHSREQQWSGGGGGRRARTPPGPGRLPGQRDGRLSPHARRLGGVAPAHRTCPARTAGRAIAAGSPAS